MTIRVLMINPVGTGYMVASLVELLDRSTLPGIEVDVEYLANGVPPTAFLPLPTISHNQILHAAATAHERGYDAVVVACAADPAVTVAKSVSRIPVTGPMEAAFHTAAALGGRLGVVTAKLEPGPREHQPTTVNWLRELIQQYGMWHRFAVCVRPIRSTRSATKPKSFCVAIQQVCGNRYNGVWRGRDSNSRDSSWSATTQQRCRSRARSGPDFLNRCVASSTYP